MIFFKILFLTLILTLEAVALASPLPSQFLIKTMAGKHAGNKSIRIRSVITQLEGDKATSLHFKQTMVYNFQSKTLRSWAMDDTDKKLYFQERKASLPLVDTVLLDPHVKPVTDQLKGQNIPIKTEEELLLLKDENERRAAEMVSLDRWKRTPAWIIGPKGKAEPQIWIEKESFLPIRLIFSNEAADGLEDIRFENYRYVSEFPFPRLITVLKKETPILHEEVIDVVMDQDPEPKEGRSSMVTPGYTDQGNSAPSDVRALITQYYEMVR